MRMPPLAPKLKDLDTIRNIPNPRETLEQHFFLYTAEHYGVKYRTA